jgi:predicted TIM-barrel fold metal-dependent hydrolase
MTTTAPQTQAAAIRARVDHPIIDGDSHIVEFTPVFNDYLKKVGGSEMVDRLAGSGRNGRGKGWHSIDWDERRHRQVVRPPWWALPTKNTLDRATSMLPKLYHERLPDFGMDFVVLYPTVGLGFPHIVDDELRQAACRAFNEFTAASYGEYGDRMTVAAVIPLHTPEEGLAELEHAHDLGLKVAQIPAFVRRPVPAIAEKYPELANTVTWYDSFGIDSPHDYDPFWARCVELGFAVASHSAGMGLPDRASVSNYMHNHMGHFAAAGEMLCKALLMGGVTRRFPDLRVGLLEGGVANGCRLYADIIARWEKRNLDAQENLDPANLDLELAQSLFQEYGDEATLAKLDELDKALGLGPRDIDASLRDDFAAMEIERPEDFRDLFIPSFYFGCEADDPLNAWAFDRNVNPFDSQIRAIMSTDLGHWDVPDMTKAVAEAYEPIENGLFSADDFRTFAFTNQVRLYAHTNRDFFNGTAVEAAAADMLVDEAMP